MTETDLCNLALGKIGGAGDALNGNAFITDINGTDNISVWCKFALPRVRRRVIIDLATRGCPFRETIRFADLGSALKDTPEIGQYLYAFNLPADCLCVSRQFNENLIASRKKELYQWETIANSDGTGLIFLTNNYSNLDSTSAFVEYAIDIPNVNAHSEQMIDCEATLLASELCPMVGKDMEARLNMTREYIEKSIPDAQRVNQKGLNNSARVVKDFSGGRTGGISLVANAGLGSYVDAEGNRRDI